MSSGFISEAEIAEQRKLRQQEWEKVRTPDQPLEAPEEPYDPRSLFDRLQEQKHKRDAEYEEAHKLKNMIKGLDDDEVEFLDLVDRTKIEEERKKNLEEEKEMREFKAKVASLQEKSLDERLKQELRSPQISSRSTTRSSQIKLVAGIVKKSTKTESSTSPQGIKRKLSDSDENSKDKKEQITPEEKTKGTISTTTIRNSSSEGAEITGALKCIGILPGLGCYDNSTDSDSSSDSEPETVCKKKKLDIIGRPIVPPKEEQ
ncbi:PSME3-interacting protein [Phymastichus coffea]|uniref:PSME3-interacting protein n=1 Tax=Phymastichus coffea TaxID=108790 RepID=UPI00273B2C89|nr:PSME3-interacting protein [Phymastichus coffea]